MRRPFSTIPDTAQHRLSRFQRCIVMLLACLTFLVCAAAGAFVLGGVSDDRTPYATPCMFLLVLVAAYEVAKGSKRWLCEHLFSSTVNDNNRNAS